MSIDNVIETVQEPLLSLDVIPSYASNGTTGAATTTTSAVSRPLLDRFLPKIANQQVFRFKAYSSGMGCYRVVDLELSWEDTDKTHRVYWIGDVKKDGSFVRESPAHLDYESPNHLRWVAWRPNDTACRLEVSIVDPESVTYHWAESANYLWEWTMVRGGMPTTHKRLHSSSSCGEPGMCKVGRKKKK